LSANELEAIARLIDRTPPRIPVWVFTSRIVRDANPEAVGIIERHGGRVLADTCLEVTLLEHRFGTVATPSGKGAYYLPSLCKQKVIFDDVETLLERYACGFEHAESSPAGRPARRSIRRPPPRGDSDRGPRGRRRPPHGRPNHRRRESGFARAPGREGQARRDGDPPKPRTDPHRPSEPESRHLPRTLVRHLRAHRRPRGSETP